MSPLRLISRPPQWITGVKLLALFLLILGAKLCLMRAYSVPLPFYDQWEAEGRHIIQPFLHGTLRWEDFFTPHMQHRIVWTRLFVLGLFWVNGQWDTQAEMIVAAILHAWCATALGGILIQRLGRAVENAILLCLLALFALPFAWENTLSGGFQSQYYFLIGFSVAAIWGLGSHRPWTAPWFFGFAAGLLAWFSVASGPFAGFSVAAWMAWKLWRREGNLREQWTTFAVAMALGLAGMTLFIAAHSASRALQPSTIGEFAWKWLGLLSWPVAAPWAAAVMYAPLAWLGWTHLRAPRNSAGHPVDAFLVPFSIFVLLQTTAIAFARNHYRDLLVSRYMDILSLGLLVNFACLLRCGRDLANPRARAWAGAFAAGWIGLAAFGLHALTTEDLNATLPFIKHNNLSEEVNVAALAADPEPRRLQGKTTFDFQCDDQKTILGVLMDPAMRAVLPSRMRQPLALTPAIAEGGVSKIAVPSGATSANAGWIVAPPAAGLSRFRSGTMRTDLPWLDFAVSGEILPDSRICLVGERTGRTTWLLPDNGEVTGWWTTRVEAPAEPFFLEAVVHAGAPGALTFLGPREVGRLSAWVDLFFGSAVGLMFAGAALWAGVGFLRQKTLDRPMPAPSPLTLAG